MENQRNTDNLIKLSPYDKKWPLEYVKEVEFLKRAIPSYTNSRFYHIGSTSINGMTSTGIIDILITCPLLEILTIANILKSKNYIFCQKSSHLRHYIFAKNVNGKVKYLIHVLPNNSKTARDYLRFKNILLSDIHVQNQYYIFKYSIANKNISINKYTTLKREYISHILRK